MQFFKKKKQNENIFSIFAKTKEYIFVLLT